MVETLKPCEGKQKREGIKCVYSQLLLWLSSPIGSPASATVLWPELQQDGASHSLVPNFPSDYNAEHCRSQEPLASAYHATLLRPFSLDFPSKQLHEEGTIIDPSFRGGERGAESWGNLPKDEWKVETP